MPGRLPRGLPPPAFSFRRPGREGKGRPWHPKKTKNRSIKTQKAVRHFAGARLFDLKMVAGAPMGRRFRAGGSPPGRASAEEPRAQDSPGRQKKTKLS